MSSAARFFAAAAAAFLVFVLTQGTVPNVEAGAVAEFSPDPLFILDGRSEVLTVTVDKEVTQEEIDAGAIDVELVQPGNVSDTEILAKDAKVPPGTMAGDTISVMVKFTIKCVDNEIVGTGENSVAFEIEFGSTNSNALGSGQVTCSGKAIVMFDPVPLEVPDGSTKKVKVTITKELTAEEAFMARIHVRLVEPGILDDTLLDTKDLKFRGGTRVGSKKTVTATFKIECTFNEIRGKLAGTDTDDAELSIEFTANGSNHGTGQAICVDTDFSQVPSSGFSPSGVAIDSESGYAYALNAFDGAIGVFDGATLIRTINLPCDAVLAGVSSVEPTDDEVACTYQGIVLVPVSLIGFDIYATNRLTREVVSVYASVLNGTAASHEVTTIAVGAGPTGIDADLSTGQLYVANVDDGTVSVVDVNTDTVTNTITVGGVPNGVIVDSANGIAYVSNFTLDVVHVIDTATNTEVDTINVGAGPDSMEIDHDTGTLWVTNFLGNSVTVVDLYTSPLAISSLPTTINLGFGTGPNDISLNMYTNRLYTANALNDTVSVIDRTTRQLAGTIDVGDTPDAVAAHGKKGIIYVANHGENSLSLISDPNPYVQRRWGDLGCDGLVNADDVLAALRAHGELPDQAGNDCPAFGEEVDVLPYAYGSQTWGDPNCDGLLDGHDPLLLILAFAGALEPNGDPGCPDVNKTVYVW